MQKGSIEHGFSLSTGRNGSENYLDAGGVEFAINPDLKTINKYHGSIIKMLRDYINIFVTRINNDMCHGLERDFTQRDIFALIAELVNLHNSDSELNAQKAQVTYYNFVNK